MTTQANKSTELEPWKLHQLQKQLKDWAFAGQHHMHKSWRFRNAQQALRWYALARKLSERQSRDCFFYLGHVGSGRIETDILNRAHGHLTKKDLDLAEMMNAIEIHVKNFSPDTDVFYRCEAVEEPNQTGTPLDADPGHEQPAESGDP
jgi:pterin-4a-carbinolamine dehydratase